MPVIQHPAFSRITRDVPKSEVARWVKAGWVDTTAKPAKSETGTKADDEKPKSTQKTT